MKYSLFTHRTKDQGQTKVATRTYFNSAQWVGITVDWHILDTWECRISYVVEKSAQSQPRPQHRGKCKRKKAKAVFRVPTEFFLDIITMASVNIQGDYEMRTVVSALLLLCKVCSVQCVLVFWFFSPVKSYENNDTAVYFSFHMETCSSYTK